MVSRCESTIITLYLPSRDSDLMRDYQQTCCSFLNTACLCEGGFVLGRALSLICNAWAEFTPW